MYLLSIRRYADAHWLMLQNRSQANPHGSFKPKRNGDKCLRCGYSECSEQNKCPALDKYFTDKKEY